MDWLHFYNPENFRNHRFLTTKCRNEVSLHLWMVWLSCTQMLFKETSSTCFICRGKLNNWTVWYIYLQYHSIIPCSILPFFLFFTVYNVEICVSSSYLDNNFTVLCHAYLTSKTYLGKCALCCWWLKSIFPTSVFEFLINIPNNWSWGMVFNAGIKVFVRRLYYIRFLVCIFELIFLYIKTKYIEFLIYWWG